MSDPLELLALARQLSEEPAEPPPTDAQLRRAVSTAYYAVFHKVLRAAAERFIGADQQHTAGFTLLYRAFDHRHMKTTCEALQATTLKDKFRRHLGRLSVSTATREFATSSPVLQDKRHQADYDPSVEFQPPDVRFVIDVATATIEAFDVIDPVEKADVLALLMVGARN